MDLFQTVRQQVSLPQAAQRYGLEVRRSRRALCPFHNDHDPSLLVTEDHYHCFACGAHGDVVDLTAQMLGLRPLEAARRLAEDFGIDPGHPPSGSPVRQRPAAGSAEIRFIRALTRYVENLEQWRQDYAPREPGEPMDIRFLESCRCLAPAKHYLDTLIQGTPAQRLQALEYLQKEEC